MKSGKDLWVFSKQLVDEFHRIAIEKQVEDNLWLVVAQNKLPEYFFCTYRLRPGDVIKFGKIRYKVLEANTSMYRKEQAKNAKVSDVY